MGIKDSRHHIVRRNVVDPLALAVHSSNREEHIHRHQHGEHRRQNTAHPLGNLLNAAGQGRIQVLHPHQAQDAPEEGVHQVGAAADIKGESLYSQETVPNTACCTKLHRYSKAPPINMLAKKIMMSF